MFKNALQEIIDNIGIVIVFAIVIVGIIWALISGLAGNLTDYFNNISFFEFVAHLVDFSGGEAADLQP